MAKEDLEVQYKIYDPEWQRLEMHRSTLEKGKLGIVMLMRKTAENSVTECVITQFQFRDAVITDSDSELKM